MTSFSIIIPVIDEAHIVNESIEHVYRVGAGFDIEVIVVDGDPCGGTIRAITDERTIRITSDSGRGRQMNSGASIARGDVLVFLHADTHLPPNAFESIDCLLARCGCVGGAFNLGIDSDRFVYRIIERTVDMRTRVTKVPYGDQAIFLRRDFFERVGRFSEMPIMEDVDLMRRVKRSGYKTGIIPHRVQTSPRRWEREGVLLCTMRNWMLIGLYLLGVAPEKLARFYYRDVNGKM